MRGVHIKKALVVHEDERRKLVEISNGLGSWKNLKVLYTKKGEHILGNHYHTYAEVRYLLKGKVHYKLKNTITQEVYEFDMEAGDVMWNAGYVVHTGVFGEDCIMLEGAAETFISADYNDFPEKIL